jgi:hypothetical protein
MRYWWVNQNQTYRHEVQGGYLWSPKRSANGARNPFYESMREVAPSDLIFSFMNTRILAIGIAQSYCWESPKPLEFGNSGQNWENIGWRVKVNFTLLNNKVRPKDHIDILRPLLPDRYSPLQSTGNGPPICLSHRGAHGARRSAYRVDRSGSRTHRRASDKGETVNVGVFTSGQKQFLDFHRNAVLLQSIRT